MKWGNCMEYISEIYSDIGIVKKVNQDAALVRRAETDYGTVLFAVICDGMGGLQKGELASSTAVSEMSDWFEQTVPELVYGGAAPTAIKQSFTKVCRSLNDRIRRYGESKGIQLGTTMAALLLIKDAYYICNIGDSRIYYLNKQIRQMTRDQSYIQQEMDMGRMTEAEARRSAQRNVLLQCIGVSETVTPDFYIGEFSPDCAFLLCTDGFVHVQSAEEMLKCLKPDLLGDEADIRERLRNLTETVKSRKEEDNITSVLISVKQGA